MDKIFVAQRVATKLYATEAAIDAAIIETTGMIAELVQARKDLGAAAGLANVASAKLADAVATLSAARTAVIEAHADIDEARLRVGIRTKMAGWISIDDTKGSQELRAVS